MMRNTVGVEFRARTEIPEEPGFYYARFLEPTNLDEPAGLFPVRVRLNKFGGRYVVIPESGFKFNPKEFFWYGPVREVREASAP